MMNCLFVVHFFRFLPRFIRASTTVQYQHGTSRNPATPYFIKKGVKKAIQYHNNVCKVHTVPVHVQYHKPKPNAQRR